MINIMLFFDITDVLVFPLVFSCLLLSTGMGITTGEIVGGFVVELTEDQHLEFDSFVNFFV
jgi:hypothetical protein